MSGLGGACCGSSGSAQACRGAGGRRVLSVDEEHNAHLELCLVCVRRGKEGKEEEEEGVKGGMLSCVRAPPFLGRRLAKRAGPRRTTEAEQAAPKMATTRGLEGMPLQEEGIASPREPGP
jgi:hypothetical protein